MLQLERLSRELVARLKTMALHDSHFAELAACLDQIEDDRLKAQEQIEEARCCYASDDIEIDDVPLVSRTDDNNGAWISAWVRIAPDVDSEQDGL
jgi:hypothetical protein